MQFCDCLVCENLCIIFEQVQFYLAGTPLLTMLHQDYLLPVPSNRLFTQAEATSLHVLVPFRRNLHLIPLNPRKKHVKTFFHDITVSKRDVSGHIHPTRLLKHFFEPISLLDMSLNQNKPKISSLRTKHSYCIFRLSIQASRNKSWNVK